MKWYAIINRGSLLMKRYAQREYDQDATSGRRVVGPFEADNIQVARAKAREIRGTVLEQR